MEWFRYYTRTLDCRKVQALPPPLFKHWVNLLCVSSLHGGVLPALSEIAFRLRFTERTAQQIVDSLCTAKLVDRNDDGTFQMHDWNEHQYVSDDVAKRVRKHREKQVGNVTGNVPVTPSEQNRTESEQNQKQNG